MRTPLGSLLSHVAIRAQDLYPVRVTELLDAPGDVRPVSIDPAFCGASPIHMIENQELGVVLPTADTGTAVCFQDPETSLPTPLSVPGPRLFKILSVPLAAVRAALLQSFRAVIDLPRHADDSTPGVEEASNV